MAAFRALSTIDEIPDCLKDPLFQNLSGPDSVFTDAEREGMEMEIGTLLEADSDDEVL